MRVVELFARLYPWPVTPSDNLDRAVGFLKWNHSASTVVRASYGLGLLGGGLTLSGSLFAPAPLRLLVTFAVATVTLFAVVGMTAVPRLLATARRTRALGDAPGLVGRAVLSMRLSPSPERAAVFAASGADTLLAARLDRHVRRARVTQDCPLRRFGEDWGRWFPALDRALALVATAATLSPDDRAETLDRSLTVVLEGTREQLRTFGTQLRGPVTALYAFGILLPTALVALLPAAAAAGVGVGPIVVAVLYDLLLPVVLVVAAAWLLARRPATVPPPAVDRTHPDVPDSAWRALAAGVAAGVVGGFVASRVLPSWAPPLAGLGFGAGVALLVHYRPYLAVHEEVRAVEDGLTDALSLVGRRVSAGRSVEAAVATSADDLTGPVGEVFAEATTLQRNLQVDIERAFLGPNGALDGIPSQRTQESVAFLSLAATHGRPAGRALRALADHISELSRVEAAAIHSLESVCDTLQSTGALFGPLVAGATVALADGMTGATARGLPGGGTELPWLGLAVGWYVLVLACLLPALATGLVRGLDRALLGVRVGRALVSATAVYLVAYLLVGGIA